MGTFATGDQLVGVNRANFNAQPGDAVDEPLCDSMLQKVVVLTKTAADGAAATATTAPANATIGVTWAADRQYKIVAAYFVPEVAITADPTNFATLQVAVRAPGAAANGYTTVAASGALTPTGLGSVALSTRSAAFALSATAGATTVAAGASITFLITKSGAGLVVPPGQWIVVLQPF